MLIEFSVTNFLSFKNRATLSMVASTDDTLEESNVITAEKQRLVRSAVVYGANASGKSNLLAALAFMRRMVLNSSKESQANEEIGLDTFQLSTDCDSMPARFEIVFISKGTPYRYGFDVDRKQLRSEWLFSRPSTKEAMCFLREKTNIKVNLERFKEGSGLEERTRQNALFLSVCAQFNGEVSADLLAWFQDLRCVGFTRLGFHNATVERLQSPVDKARVLEFTRIADPSITDFVLHTEKWIMDSLPKDMPDEMKRNIVKRGGMMVKLRTKHRKFDAENRETAMVEFDIKKESAGTQKLVMLSGILFDVLETGKVLVVDELDARMHALLTRLIVSLFNSPSNRSNAQLIFASHDTTLLTPKLFRRDQVWFTEKDQYGATELFSLLEMKGVRKDAAFGKDYIQGKYGAIPFIGDPKWLFCEDSHE
jgi:uncharacterized protein